MQEGFKAKYSQYYKLNYVENHGVLGTAEVWINQTKYKEDDDTVEQY